MASSKLQDILKYLYNPEAGKKYAKENTKVSLPGRPFSSSEDMEFDNPEEPATIPSISSALKEKPVQTEEAPVLPRTEPVLEKPKLERPAASSIDYSKLDDLQKQRREAIAAQDPSTVAKSVQSLLDQTQADAVKQVQADPRFSKYQDTISKTGDQIQRTRGLMQGAENQAQWLSALESIGQALTQYAAARYGMETGTNLAGLKMEKADWAKLLEQSHTRLQNEIRDLQALRKEAVEGQTGLVSEAEKRGLTAAKEQLGAEEEKRKAELGTIKEAEELERFKIRNKLSQDRDTLNAMYKDLALKARQRGVQDKELATLQKLEQKDIELEGRQLANKEKALQLGLAHSANILNSRNAKDKARQVAALSADLAKAGLDPATVSAMEGFFSQKLAIQPDKAKEVISTELQKVSTRKEQLGQFMQQAAKADTADALEQIRTQRLGQVPATPAKVEPEGKIRVRRKADGQTGSILPQDFDPAKYDKI